MTNSYLFKRQRFIWTLSLLLLTALHAFSQVTVSGKITSDVDQMPLPGVNVLVKGTGTGTITDIDGLYEIEVPSGEAILVFSMVGMLTEEISVGDRTVIDLILITDIIGLQEIIVVGYGTMKKSDIAGSIVSVKGDELLEVKTNNVLESLQGKVPGLDVTPSDGRAGSGVDMFIRGKRSLQAESDPLIIVDGIPMGMKVDINPNDIESIEILKDAASTAIYGSRGANGIILITTKKGTAGEAKAYYNGYFGISDPYQHVPVFSRDDYVEAKIDANRDIYNWDVDPDPISVFGSTEYFGYQNDVTTDWQDLITRRGYQQDHHFGFTGGSDKFSYNAAVSYFNEKGVVIQNDYKRYSAQINLDAKVSEWLSGGTVTQIVHKVLDGADVSSSNYSVFTSAVRLSPMVEPYDSAGNYIWQPAAPNPRKSPLATVDDVEEDRQTRIFSNVYATVKFFEGLTFRSTIGVDYTTKRRGWMYPQKAEGEAITENGVEFRLDGGYTWNNILTFDKTYGPHHIIFTGVHEMQYNRLEPYEITGKEQADERSLWYFMETNNLDYNEMSSSLIEKKLVSVLGRLNYTYNNKYILNGAVRFDGASALSSGRKNKWDYFPAASVAWRISEEGFMENIKDVLTDMKIRLSYGSTGNASIDPYSTFGGLNDWIMYVEFGEQGSETAIQCRRPTYLAANSVTWERTDQVNFGIDFGLFQNRIYANFDLYANKTKNILMDDRVVPSSGYYSIIANSAETENRGIELSLQTVNISTPSFKWRTNITFAASKEEITKLTSGVDQDIANGWFVGEPIDVFYNYQKIGIRQIGDADSLYGAAYMPGDIRVADLDGNDTINDLDKTVLGSERPKWIGTFDNVFTYKGISLSVSIYAKWGHMVDAAAYEFDPRMYNNIIDLEYWTPLNNSNDNPRLDATITEAPFEYTMRYREASFIKLRQVTLGYDLPQKLLEKTAISRLNIYFSIKNAAVLYSKMEKGLDPERGGDLDWPLARLYTLGLNVDF